MFTKIKSLLKTTFIKLITKDDIDYSTWVFSSSFNTKFNYNSKYLFEYVIKNELGITPIYVVNDDNLRSQLKTKYGDQYFVETKSFKGIKRVLNSGVWFTSAGMPVYGFSLNKKRIIINLWHGVPLKKINLMENNISIYRKIFFKYFFSKNYTYILTTSKNLVNIMKKSFGVNDEKIKVLGQPRNDKIFSISNPREVLNSLYSDLPSYKKIILYAPTFRENSGTVFFPFTDFCQTDLDKYLEENDLIIFIRCHQLETNNLGGSISNRIRLINEDKVEDVMDIINIFDLLITDYSSMYIDFLLTEKPILFLPYDKEEYIKKRGLNFEYDSVTPGPKPKTFIDFKNEIIVLLNNNNYYMLERKKMNLFFYEVKKPCSDLIYRFVKEEVHKLESIIEGK